MTSKKEVLEKMLEKSDKNVCVMNTDDIRGYLSSYQEQNGVSKATVDNVRCNLSSFFKWLEDEELEKLRDDCRELRNLAMTLLMCSVFILRVSPGHHAPTRKRYGKNIRRLNMEVRFAKETELNRINELRKQVNDLHVEGKPDVFKPGFCDELRDFINVIWKDPEQKIVVAIADEAICGFAIIHHINKPENPFMKERDFLDIDEFCVDEAYRRKGVATDLITFIKEYAKENGFHRIELNMWEFNQGALAFYESVGFETYRRYMEIML